MRYLAAYMALLILNKLDGPGGIVLISGGTLRRHDDEVGCRHGVRSAQIGDAFGIDNNERRLPFGIFDQVKDRILFRPGQFQDCQPPYPGWSI